MTTASDVYVWYLGRYQHGADRFRLRNDSQRKRVCEMVDWTTESVRDCTINENANAHIVTEADIAEIEAYANSEAAALV